MNKHDNLFEKLLASGILGFLADYFGSLLSSYIILLVLIGIDTFTGVLKAIKYKRFSSENLKKLLRKTMLYSTSIITTRLLEIGIVSLIETTLISNIMAAVLIVTEAVSILENLSVLGVPIRSNFLGKLFERLKAGWVLQMVGDVDNTVEKYIAEIDEIIHYSLPGIENDHIKKIMEVKFEVWKDVALQISSIFTGKSFSNELLHFKVSSMINGGLRTINEKWKEAEIPEECIKNFSETHQSKVDSWIKKIYGICFSEKSLEEKKEELIESIVIILYQTVVDAQKTCKYSCGKCSCLKEQL